MDCRELEERLEALLDGALGDDERRRCEGHLATCTACRELVEPFAATVSPPEDLAGSVLARTSGAPCGRAEELLADWVDARLAGTDGELMAAHLETCADCRSLAAVMTRLTAELPGLAELRPGPGFVAAVLAATLPLSVRLRRWWRAAWPRWVRRPRFASEAAFLATMVLVLVFATPGSPLEAVPNRALVLTRIDPATRLEAPLETLGERFAARVREPLGACYARCEAEVRVWAEAAESRGRALAEEVVAWIGTSREGLASLLGRADDEASENETRNPANDSHPDQETP